jgi:hypothetical protein
MGRDLRKAGGNFVGIEKHHRSGLGADFDCVEKNNVREGTELGGGDPTFRIGAGADDVRDSGFVQFSGKSQAGAVIAIIVVADADPERGLVTESEQAMAQIRHQMTSPRRLICS